MITSLICGYYFGIRHRQVKQIVFRNEQTGKTYIFLYNTVRLSRIKDGRRQGYTAVREGVIRIRLPVIDEVKLKFPDDSLLRERIERAHHGQPLLFPAQGPCECCFQGSLLIIRPFYGQAMMINYNMGHYDTQEAYYSVTAPLPGIE
jgi:hypothetical protein